MALQAAKDERDAELQAQTEAAQQLQEYRGLNNYQFWGPPYYNYSIMGPSI